MNEINTVLLIEDNPGDARLVCEYLADRYGDQCHVLQASTLAAGLATLGSVPVDVVLLDLGLPDSRGLDAYFQVQARAPQTPVLVLTGEDDEDQAVEALRLGAEDYLAKHQTDSVTLVRAMRHALQRREMTDRLRASEARCHAVFETADEGILRADRQGRILQANQRAAQLLGAPLAGRFTEQVMPSHRVAARMLLQTPPGARHSCELQLWRGDEAPCWVVAASVGVAGPAGQDAEVVLLLTDITGRKLAEDELRALKDGLELQVLDRTARLAAANADLQAINRAMAHDLRNPLNGILGLTQLARQDPQHPLPPKADRYLQLVEQSALEMNELIGSLLSLARLDRQVLVPVPLDLSAMATTMAERLTEADPRRVVHWHISPGLQARGDRALVLDVLQNLLDNAWKYSGRQAEAVIRFGAQRLDAGDTAFFVQDNGVGFDMAMAGSLFQPFHRLATARGFAGSGLGLAGVRRIVELHGGRVWADSQRGVGSTLWFTLPAPAGSTE